MRFAKFWKWHGKSKNRNVKIMTMTGLSYVKWWEDSKSGPKIQIELHWNPFLAKKASEIDKIWKTELTNFRVLFCQKGGQMLCDFNFETRFGILHHFTYFRHLPNYYFHICIFWCTMTCSKFCKSHVRPIFPEIDFFRSYSESAPQKT